jgi:formylglycine-generating enzyme required for sulfatase activity
MRHAWVVLLAAAGAACEEESNVAIQDEEVCIDGRDGIRYCIDVYEAARSDANASQAGNDDDGRPRSTPGRLPWTEVTWFEAQGICGRAGKRLCTEAEWLDACDGVVGTGGSTYTYGDALDEPSCNVDGQGPEPGGTRSTCISAFDVFDLSGNVWEWIGPAAGDAVLVGGGFPSSREHRCTSRTDTLAARDPNLSSPEFGFRCCRDP